MIMRPEDVDEPVERRRASPLLRLGEIRRHVIAVRGMTASQPELKLANRVFVPENLAGVARL